MFDIRYHITSLIAVFLALAMGILLGTIIVDKGLLVKQKEALVERLETEFNQIKKDNRELQSELNQRNRFEEAVFISISQEQLTGQRLLLVSTSRIPKKVRDEIRNSVAQAGAEIATVNLTTSDFDLNDSKTRKKLANLLEVSSSSKVSRNELQSMIITRLAEETATPVDRELVRELINLDLIKVENEAILPVAGVIAFAGDKEEVENLTEIQLPLINEYARLGVVSVGTESKDIETSHLRLYQGIGIATVDGVDTNAGKISLIYALKGGAGNFGAKGKSEARLPPLGFKGF